MRIGKVSEIYHISADNLYYYINYGLLVPPRPKGQYVFDQATLKDLEWILELKELDFSLREIHIRDSNALNARHCAESRRIKAR